MRQFYGDLADEPRFADSFVSWLEMIWSEGLEKAISTYLDG
jgi:mannitol 2-dehydrogenase